MVDGNGEILAIVAASCCVWRRLEYEAFQLISPALPAIFGVIEWFVVRVDEVFVDGVSPMAVQLIARVTNFDPPIREIFLPPYNKPFNCPFDLAGLRLIMKPDTLPEYSETVSPWNQVPRRRKRRIFRLAALLLLVCSVLNVNILWKNVQHPSSILSVNRLQEDYATCSLLRRVPKDPSGTRMRNSRFVNGTKSLLIRNATVWIGEPAPGTSLDQAHSGEGFAWVPSDVAIEYGMIKQVAPHIPVEDYAEAYEIFDAGGRPLTAGIVDMHSHAGVDPQPNLQDDTNELSGDITPYVRSIDAFDPLDQQIQWIKSGGVTTSLVLPGSGNNMGGEAFVFKFAVGKRDGRSEISQEDMLADPERNWRYMKMACGENPKRVYGKIGRGPFSRLGEAWEFRHAFEEASKMVKAQDDWCSAADTIGPEKMGSYLPKELRWESLGAVLRGQVHVNTHCYTVADLEAFIRHTNEWQFPIRAFHHAHQTYLVPEILKRAWGGRPPAAAIFADNMYYKVEAYTASEQAGKILYENGITPVYVSDNPVLNAQHLVFEAAKGYQYGLKYHASLASVTTAPAELLGLGERIGKIKPGFDADVVVWDSDPLSVGATPVQVWIDGAAQFDDPVLLKKPIVPPSVPKSKPNETKSELIVDKTIVFTGVTKVRIRGNTNDFSSNESVHVIISNGAITCLGLCEDEVRTALKEGIDVVDLVDGYLTQPFTAVGSTIGLSEIDGEEDTKDGDNTEAVWSRAVDGLALDTKQLAAAYAHGIVRVITAPPTRRGNGRGISAGFLTGAQHALDNGAVFADEVAVHYPLTASVKTEKTPSISSAVGTLRKALLKAVHANETTTDNYSEEVYLKRVVAGELPLVLSIHSADTMAAVLRVKQEVESALSALSAGRKLRVVFVGGAESYLIANEIAAAGVGIILSPLQPYSSYWDQRRSLTGAPLTNGTALEHLLDAGILVAVGVGTENSDSRNLRLMAGIAFRNSGGRLTESGAIDLIGANIYTMMGLNESVITNDFVIFEGSPLEIGSEIRAMGHGGDSISFWAQKSTTPKR
ncbi:hypothetical protein MMC18_003280 [Xylographa bjoerkii]|nr:hypothetical protein [Xylographa bjoerkii]